ncbi:uncharacterized protein LOC143259457 [Megalopta genalis]|uniref:uncharacterized protein LOC143259457 n=1 Tax=Megalopta genalis TaxID=115081 RepID=UPI003FD33F94
MEINGQENGPSGSGSIPSSSYASVIQTCFPTKEQAIVLDALEDISVKEYIVAIGRIINPGNIRFASRIADNKICVYLSSKSVADKIVTEKLNVEVRGRPLSIRPLTAKAKHIVLSNVCPVIPHLEIESAFKKIGIRLLSPISFIKAGFTESGFTRILSFRRQVHIHPDDENKLPGHLRVNFENTGYWISVSANKQKCSLCKNEGHTAEQCRKLSNDRSNSNDSSLSRVDQTVSENRSPDTLDARADHSQATLRNASTTEASKPVKRPLVESASTESTRADSEVVTPSRAEVVAKASPTKPTPDSDGPESAQTTGTEETMTPSKKKLRKINDKKWVVLCNQ